METPVIWDDITLIMTSLLYVDYNCQCGSQEKKLRNVSSIPNIFVLEKAFEIASIGALLVRFPYAMGYYVI